MLVFDRIRRDGIKAGTITLAFRYWDTFKFLKGKIYRAQNVGYLRVLDVNFKDLMDITEEEIRCAGYETFEDFRHHFMKALDYDADYNYETERAVRIEFEYLGENIEDYQRAMGNIKESDIFNIKEQLLILEQKSFKPWIAKTLQLLKQQGHVRFKDLEKPVDIPPDMIKMFMIKLKQLQLISSSEAQGYSITPLGTKVLKHLNSRYNDIHELTEIVKGDDTY